MQPSDNTPANPSAFQGKQPVLSYAHLALKHQILEHSMMEGIAAHVLDRLKHDCVMCKRTDLRSNVLPRAVVIPVFNKKICDGKIIDDTRTDAYRACNACGIRWKRHHESKKKRKNDDPQNTNVDRKHSKKKVSKKADVAQVAAPDAPSHPPGLNVSQNSVYF